MGTYPIRCGFKSPFQTFRNLGADIKGEIALGTISVKKAEIHQKLVLPKVVSPVPK